MKSQQTLVGVFALIMPYLSVAYALSPTNSEAKQRDLLLADTVTDVGKTLKCLTEFIGDPVILNKIYNVFDTSMVPFHEPFSSLSDEEYMDIALVWLLGFLKKLQSIDKLCADLTYVCCQYHEPQSKNNVPVKLKELENLLQQFGQTTKCLLRKRQDGERETQIQAIYVKTILGIIQSYTNSLSVVEAMHVHFTAAVKELQRLETRCSNVAVSSLLCYHPRHGKMTTQNSRAKIKSKQHSNSSY